MKSPPARFCGSCGNPLEPQSDGRGRLGR
ncbi:hypothetical protein GL259_37105 [Streptomyces sp. Tu 3180]|nr:hypothetical protein GL259_37105 [Streptomyces sp. Tu 3180]